MTVKVSPDYPTLRQTAPREWENLEEVRWTVGALSGKVPVGDRTDGASVPRFLWGLFPPLDKYSIAALVHDRLYKTHECTVRTSTGGNDDKWTEVRAELSRSEADNVFLELMKRLGVKRWRRWMMWRGVRAGGGRPWRAKR